MLAVVAFSIFLTWILCALVLAGIGTLLLRRLDVECSLFDAFWAGLCITVASLEVYHFFRPVDVIITGLLCAVGVYGIILNREMLLASSQASCPFRFLAHSLLHRNSSGHRGSLRWSRRSLRHGLLRRNGRAMVRHVSARPWTHESSRTTRSEFKCVLVRGGAKPGTMA